APVRKNPRQNIGVCLDLPAIDRRNIFDCRGRRPVCLEVDDQHLPVCDGEAVDPARYARVAIAEEGCNRYLAEAPRGENLGESRIIEYGPDLFPETFALFRIEIGRRTIEIAKGCRPSVWAREIRQG